MDSSSLFIPRRVRAKSYRTGSSGQMQAKPRVTSIAHRRSACFRVVRPREKAILCICVSRGTTRCEAETPFQIPGSTLSLRTIQRKNRFNLLQALPCRGEGRNIGIFCPAATVNSSTNAESAGMMLSSEGWKCVRNRDSSDPYSTRVFLSPMSMADSSAPEVNRCLNRRKELLILEGVLRNRKDEGDGPILSRTARTLDRICFTRPYARQEAMNATTSLSGGLS